MAGQLTTTEKSCRSYYLKDLIGSTRAVVDENGTTKENRDYYPFGLLMDERQYVQGAETTEKFSGKERDTQIGFDYFGARYYMPGLGRWTSTDPMDQYASPYVYTGNNPIVFVDPDGMFSTHTDSTGHIIAEYDDGDDGVYVHSGETTKEDIDTQRSENNNTGGTGTHIGEIGGIIDVNGIYGNLLEVNTEEASSMSLFGAFTFRENVTDGGKWDYKNRKDHIIGKGNDGKTKFSFDGNLLESQDLGNHHFGAVGKAFGFPEIVLLRRAGKNQIDKGRSRPKWQQHRRKPVYGKTGSIVGYTKGSLLPPYGDDPRDQKWIKVGFNYKN